MKLHNEVGYRRGAALCFTGLAGVAATPGQPERAARFFGAAETLHEAVGASEDASNRAQTSRYIAVARGASGAAAFAAAWADGPAG